MRKKGENRLVLLRILVVIFIVAFLLILLFFPMFIEGKFNLFQFLGERLFAGDEKDILLSVPGPCVDLDNPATYGTKVSRAGTSPEYDFSINQDTLLCSKTYSFGDQSAANGVLIINADNIELDCNGAVISNPSPASADKAISITTKNNIKINSCNTTGFGYGVYAEGMTNSLINNSLFFSALNGVAVYLGVDSSNVGSSNNYLDKINITTNNPLSIGANIGIRIYANSQNNVINNSFIYDTNLHAIYTEGNYTKIYRTTIVNSSVDGNNQNGAIRINDAVGTIIDSVNITKSMRGIVFASGLPKHCGNSSVSNVFIKNSVNTPTFVQDGYGIQNRFGCPDITISDSTVENSTTSGISIEENNASIFRTFINGTYRTSDPDDVRGGIVVWNTADLQGTKQLRNIRIEDVRVMNSSSAGIRIRASNVTIVGAISMENGQNINFGYSGNSLVVDSVFEDATIANSDVNLSASGGEANANRTNITFINSNFSGFGTSSKTRTQLTVNWWLDVLAQHISGAPLEGANIKAVDRSDIERLSDITGLDGRIGRKNLTEFIYASNSHFYFNNYSINASFPGYGNQGRFINISASRFEVFSFTIDTVLPLISYTSKTAADGAIVNRDWVYVDVDITEDNFKSISFNLYNSSRDLAALAAGIYHYGFDLDKYNLTTNNFDLTTRGLSTLVVDISGVTHNPVTNTLFLINNNPVAGAPFNDRNVMIEIDMNYNWIWNIYLTRSDIIDSEGIAYVGTNSATGKHKFAVVEESKNIGKHAFLYIFEIDRSTTQINLATQATEYDLGDMASDDGIEGVSYGGKDISGNLIFYVVRQTPKDVRKVVVVSGTTTVVSNTRLFDSTALSDVGWLRDLYYDNNTNSLFILGVGASDTAPRKVINVRLDGTRIFDISGIDVGSPIKPEGIVFDKFGDYMYVVGEPHHLSAFKTANYHSKNNFTNLSAGIYYYNVSVEDLGGNKAATSTRKITLVGVSSCSELNIIGANYTLLQNLSSSGTCFNITANDIGLNGNGYTVTYGTSGTEWSLGIAILGANMTAIQNISVIEGTHLGSTKPAINFGSSFNGSLRDAIIKTNGTNSSGINIAESSGVVIANSYINTSDVGSKGIYLHPFSTGVTITNTSIFTYGSESYGVHFQLGSSGNQVINNTIITSGFASRGMIIDYSYNANLTSNTIFTFGLSAFGIEVRANADNIFIAHNNITALNSYSLYPHQGVSNGIVVNNTFTTSLGGGIFLWDRVSGFRFANSTIFAKGGNGIVFANGIAATSNNTFSGISFNIEGSSGNGISVESLDHSFSFYDSIFNVSSSGGSNLFISSAVSSGEWNFTNVSRSAGGPFTKNWQAGAVGMLNVFWYVDAYANDSFSLPLANVNVSAFNRYYQLLPPEYPVSFSVLTGADGRIAEQAILDYNQTSPTAITVHSNYTFSAVDSLGRISPSQSWNITEMNNTNLVFNFDTIFPLIFFVPPTPLDGAVIADTSIDVNVSIIESDLYEAKFNWNNVNYTLYDDSLVLMMNMDNLGILGESSALIKDLSKYGNDGIVSGAVVNTFGKYGGAFTFDGINDYIDLGISSVLNNNINDITISAWVKLEADLCHVDTNYNIFTNELLDDYGYILRIGDYTAPSGSCGIIFFRTSNAGTIPTSSQANTLSLTYPNDNAWHYVTAVKDGSNAFIYLDGVQVASNIGGIISPANSPISSKISGLEQSFDGSIDEVRIWNRGLSSNEVKEQYYSNLYRYNQTQWYITVNQSGLVDGGYTYFASAKDRAGNENLTEVRSAAIFIPPSVIDIYKTPGTPASGNMLAQGIAPDADNPITFGLTVLSFGGLSRIGSVRASFTSQFDSTVRGPSICTQASPTGNGANDFYYSCTINIRYFDPPGVWDVKAAVQDSSNSQWSADYIETFVLMSEKYLRNDPSISFGSVNPGAQNIENNLQIRNVGNDLISEIKLLGNDLVGESDNTKKIFLVDFAAKSSIGSCITGSAIGYIETAIPGFNLPRGDNSLGFGIADLYLCLKQAPFGTSQIYSAKGANAWQITYPPEG